MPNFLHDHRIDQRIGCVVPGRVGGVKSLHIGHPRQQRSTYTIQPCLEPMASLTNLDVSFIDSVGIAAHGEYEKETGSDMMWYW